MSSDPLDAPIPDDFGNLDLPADDDILEPLPFSADGKKNKSSFSFGSFNSLFNSLSRSIEARRVRKRARSAQQPTTEAALLQMPPDHIESRAPPPTFDDTSEDAKRRRKTSEKKARKSVHDRDRRSQMNSLFSRLRGALGMDSAAGGRQAVMERAVAQLENQEENGEL